MKGVWLASWRDINYEVQHCPLVKVRSSNQAEYGSMLMVLDHIYKRAPTNPWLEECVIYGDSLLVIEQMNGVYKTHNAELGRLKCEAYHAIDIIKTKFNISIKFKWIGRKDNNIALELNTKLPDPDISPFVCLQNIPRWKGDKENGKDECIIDKP